MRLRSPRLRSRGLTARSGSAYGAPPSQDHAMPIANHRAAVRDRLGSRVSKGILPQLSLSQPIYIELYSKPYMPPRARLRGPRPGRVLGLYALSVMDRDGPIYGYSLANRISDRTDGAWRPGAGAIYPALQSLVAKGFARSGREGRRQVYTITSRGRTALAQIRRGPMGGRGTGPDLGLLWSEIVSPGDPGQHLVRHLHHHLEAIGEYLERDPQMKAGRVSLREQVETELQAAETRLKSLEIISRPPHRAPRSREAARV